MVEKLRQKPYWWLVMREFPAVVLVLNTNEESIRYATFSTAVEMTGRREIGL